MAARLKRFDSAPPGKKVVKISTDVYPDPEPDVGITAAAIAAVIQEKKPVVPTKVFMDKEGRLVDEEGNVIPEEGKAPSRKRKAEAIEEEETVLDSALVKRQRKGRKGALQLLDHPEEDAERHTKQADKLRSIEESRKEYIEKRKLADAAMEAGEKLMIDQEGADMLKATPAIVPVNTTTMEVLEAEWWDAAITVNKTYGDITAAPSPLSWNLKHKMISSLIEHPVPSNGQHVEKHLAPQALILTQKERLKVRKQSRIAREKEKQKQIALGLLPTPPPKVKISNMARVFQHKFIADPTACEQFAREEMMKRVGNHEDRNQVCVFFFKMSKNKIKINPFKQARKLSKDQKREKTINKLKREAETDPITTVYRYDHFPPPPFFAFSFQLKHSLYDFIYS